jgi:hypothetical protein
MPLQMKVARCYRRFRYSIQCGKAIDIEHLWTEFAGVWLLLRKRIYTEISLKQMEDLYRKCDYWLLQTIRDNRTSRIHGGTRKDGKPFAHRATDDIMEDLQWRYKDQAFRCTKNDWVNHSRNMPYTTQSITFVNKEFVKRAGVEGQDAYNNVTDGNIERGNKYQSTVEPRHAQQLRMISEIFSLTEIFQKKRAVGSPTEAHHGLDKN